MDTDLLDFVFFVFSGVTLKNELHAHPLCSPVIMAVAFV